MTKANGLKLSVKTRELTLAEVDSVVGGVIATKPKGPAPGGTGWTTCYTGSFATQSYNVATTSGY